MAQTLPSTQRNLPYNPCNIPFFNSPATRQLHIASHKNGGFKHEKEVMEGLSLSCTSPFTQIITKANLLMTQSANVHTFCAQSVDGATKNIFDAKGGLIAMDQEWVIPPLHNVVYALLEAVNKWIVGGHTDMLDGAHPPCRETMTVTDQEDL